MSTNETIETPETDAYMAKVWAGLEKLHRVPDQEEWKHVFREALNHAGSLERRAILAEREVATLAQCVKDWNKSSSRKMLAANLSFLWDRYLTNPSEELPEHLKFKKIEPEKQP